MIEVDALSVPKHTRRKHDAYDTDPACALGCARWLVAALGLSPEGHEASGERFNILDPMAGGGPFVRAARAVWPDAKIAAIDIRPECEAPLREAGANFIGITDVLAAPQGVFSRVDLVLTNPSFVDAEALVRHLWPGLHDGASIALLLSCTFIAGADRWADADHPAGATRDGLYSIAPLRFMAPIIPRPDFGVIIDGKESGPKFEACLYCWVKGYSGPVKIPGPVRWDKANRTRKSKKAAAP
jgi:hypothetical protein